MPDTRSVAILFGFSVAAISLFYRFRRNRQRQLPRASGFEQLVGATPMVYLSSLSRLTGIPVYGKCEFLNPGGSVKDRVALALVQHAKQLGFSGVVEATSGSTGISLAMAGRALNMQVKIFMPSDVAKEKRELIQALGGEVTVVQPVSISHPMHMCRQAERLAASQPTTLYYTDQFETLVNSATHAKSTACEIIQQLPQLGCFLASSGTGGTIAGVSSHLKTLKPTLTVILADPQGSALAYRVNHGILFHPNDREGHRTREIKDTITEGIGLNRLTANFKLAVIDSAVSVSDEEAVLMSRYILDNEGLFLGSSSAVNLVGVLKAARRGLIDKTCPAVCTILCDSGQRHISKFWSPHLTPASTDGRRLTDKDLSAIQ